MIWKNEDLLLMLANLASQKFWKKVSKGGSRIATTIGDPLKMLAHVREH
jgi:hypothetical protein